MQKQYTAVYRKLGRWYVAEVPEVPGAFSQGRTLREARSNIKEALTLMLEAEQDFPESDVEGKIVLREKVKVSGKR